MKASEIAAVINDFAIYKQFHGTSVRSVVVCLNCVLVGRGVDRLKIKGQRASSYRLSL